MHETKITCDAKYAYHGVWQPCMAWTTLGRVTGWTLSKNSDYCPKHTQMHPTLRKVGQS